MIPFITCEVSLGQYVCELVFLCQKIWFGSWGQDWFDRTTNQEQLCGFWKRVSFSGFIPLWSFWSLLRCLEKHATKLLMRRLDVWRNKVNIVQIIDHTSRLLASVNCVRWRTHFTLVLKQVALFCMVLIVFSRIATIRSHKSSAGIPSNPNSATNEIICYSVELCETEVCFLHIQLIGTNVWLLKTQSSTRSRFRILKMSWKIWVSNLSKSALLGGIIHVTIRFIFICVMDVRYQTI